MKEDERNEESKGSKIKYSALERNGEEGTAALRKARRKLAKGKEREERILCSRK